MSAEGVDLKRRRFLTAAASVVGGVGVVAVAVPFVSSMEPSARAKAAGAPVEADISKLAPGQMITVPWRGKPVWLVNRSKTVLDILPTLDGNLLDPHSDQSEQPADCKNEARSIKPELLVMVGICTHLGCSPTYRPDIAPADLGPNWKGGFFCPCHGSRYDLAGRVFKDMPAPLNMVVPPHHYLSDTRILIGAEEGAA